MVNGAVMMGFTAGGERTSAGIYILHVVLGF